ncbi:MAG: hypothetical protein FWD47_07000 [Treponema sp.]|nr:hypothetical protein [Treponema sp.]
MKKINILWIILDLIFLVIFNAIFFMAGGTDHSTSVWISYGFIHFAYLMLVLTPFLIRKGKSAHVFGYSLYSISSIYFLIQFVTGIVFIFISPESITAAFLIQLCLAGLYGVILVSNMIANEHTANAEEVRQNQIAFVKDASAKIKILLENINDKEAKKQVERVYDAVYSSPIKSHHNLTEIESRILHSINALENEISTGNNTNIITLATSLLNEVNERNVKLKALN